MFAAVSPTLVGVILMVAHVTVPEGGSPWAYLAVASAACFGVVAFRFVSRAKQGRAE